MKLPFVIDARVGDRVLSSPPNACTLPVTSPYLPLRQDAEPMELFPAGTSMPAVCDKDFSRKNLSAGLDVDLEVVQWVEACVGGGGVAGEGRKSSGKSKKSSSASVARWVTIQRLGNPLTMQDNRYVECVNVRVGGVFRCGVVVVDWLSEQKRRFHPCF